MALILYCVVCDTPPSRTSSAPLGLPLQRVHAIRSVSMTVLTHHHEFTAAGGSAL